MKIFLCKHYKKYENKSPQKSLNLTSRKSCGFSMFNYNEILIGIYLFYLPVFNSESEFNFSTILRD